MHLLLMHLLLKQPMTKAVATDAVAKAASNSRYVSIGQHMNLNKVILLKLLYEAATKQESDF